MDQPQSSPGRSRLPACLFALLAVLAVPSVAQNRQKAVGAAPLLKEPSGLRLGSLVSGVTYLVGRSNSGHLETTVEGWIPVASTDPTTRDGFDMIVTSGGGEAVRSAPSGAVVARVQEGTLLTRVSTRGTWVRVRRSGWVARGAFEQAPATVAQAPPPPPPAPQNTPAAAQPTTVPPPAPPPISTRPTNPSNADTTRRNDASSGENVSSRGRVRQGAVLAVAPDGARVARVEEAPVRVIERQRDWVKVAVEGWIRSSELTDAVDEAPTVTGAMVRGQPDRYVGQTLRWRIQYLSVQLADDLRPEMPRGQPYVLARGPLPEPGFVYLMVTKEQAEEFKTRSPLDEVVVEAVVRAGRTKYLPTPVLEFRGLAGGAP